MLKLIKYSFVYLATIIMLLHNVIPHAHKSEVDSIEHAQIHQSETTSATNFLTLLFHEFTEEGEMEDILVKANTQITLSVVFIASLTINNFTIVVLSEEKEPKQYILPLNERYQASGFSTAWSIRPPPFA